MYKLAKVAKNTIGDERRLRRPKDNVVEYPLYIEESHNGTDDNGSQRPYKVPPKLLNMVHEGHLSSIVYIMSLP